MGTRVMIDHAALLQLARVQDRPPRWHRSIAIRPLA